MSKSEKLSGDWRRYPEEAPRFSGQYFVTYVRDGKVLTGHYKFLSSAQFDCEIWGTKVIAWAPIVPPDPAPELVAEYEHGEE